MRIGLKQMAVVITVSVLACAGANAARAQSRNSDAQKQQETLMNMEERWMQAVKTNQPSLVAPMLADTFIQTQSNGKLRGKQELLDSLMNSRMTWQQAELSDIKIDIYGGAAVVTGRFRGEATLDAKPIRVDERWTDTWIRQDGSWKCVASHASEMGESAEADAEE